LPTPPSSAAPREPARRAPDPRGAPLAPPDGIAPEPAVPPRDAAGVDGGLEPLSETGVPAGIGTADAIDVPAPPLPKPPAPVRVGGAVRPPQRIAYVAPQYPPLAQATRVEGEVQIEAIIGTDGTVQQLRVLRGAALLDAAALDAVRQWRYTPTLLNGIPVPVVMTVTVSFRLR
jgi:protein TonB